MNKKIVYLVVLLWLNLELSSGAPLNSNEVEARKFVDEVSKRMFTLLQSPEIDLTAVENTDLEAALKILTTVAKTTNALVEITNEAKAFDSSQFQDKELKYIFDILRRFAGEAIVGPEKYLAMLVYESGLDELEGSKAIEAYHNSSVKLAYFPDVEDIIARSNDPEELVYYWLASRKVIKSSLANFVVIIETIREAAKLTEMTPYDYWMDNYNVTEMEEVMTQIQPLYMQLHAFIRKQLNHKYGDQVIKPDGPIPDHLFQQVLAQIWTEGSVVDDVFPHKNLPPYDEILVKNNYDTLKLYKTADKFYQSMGFNPVPDDVWGTRFRMRKDKDEGDCKATIFDLTPDIYMQYCQKMDFKKFLQAHGYMGQIYYAREKKDLPAYYYGSHDLEYPVGEAVALSASTPKHLTAIGLVTDFDFTDEVLMNRLLRMSIHTLLNIPVFYVHTKIMADLFSETIPMEIFNKHYWKLMEKYVGVEPPVDRDTEACDFPFKFFVDLSNNPQPTKFDSEVLGYQFYKKLCEISGQYPKEPLHDCDFYGSTAAGNALKKMMQLGESKPFNEVLAEMLPENPKVDAEALLEYYRPIKAWLTDKNSEANLKLGWTHTDKKIGATRQT